MCQYNGSRINDSDFIFRRAYSDEEREQFQSKLDFGVGVEEEGIHIEQEIDENSFWNEVEFTQRNDDQIQTFTRGLTPSQIKNNKGSMPE